MMRPDNRLRSFSRKRAWGRIVTLDDFPEVNSFVFDFSAPYVRIHSDAQGRKGDHWIEEHTVREVK